MHCFMEIFIITVSLMLCLFYDDYCYHHRRRHHHHYHYQYHGCCCYNQYCYHHYDTASISILQSFMQLPFIGIFRTLFNSISTAT